MGLFDKLFKPQWMSEIDYQAVEGVKEVDDPDTLRRIMAEAPTSGARVAAMVKLDDQALFREIALASEDGGLAYEAALRVDDATTLHRLGKVLLEVRARAQGQLMGRNLVSGEAPHSACALRRSSRYSASQGQPSNASAAQLAMREASPSITSSRSA